ARVDAARRDVGNGSRGGARCVDPRADGTDPGHPGFIGGDMASPHDAELVLKLYDLRREPVMRQARIDVQGKFVPKSFEDVQAVTKPDHPINTAYRMVSSYWEMAAGFVKHKALDLDLFAENCAEGLFLFAKVEPYLDR